MRIGTLIVLLGLTAQPALAATLQDVSDCKVVASEDAQIAACTRVIEDKATPAYELAMALYNRGTAYESKGAYQEALADYNKLLKGRPIGTGLCQSRLGVPAAARLPALDRRSQ